MTTKRAKLVFLIFPSVIILLWYLLKKAAGTFFLNFADPSFTYLTSSLNVVQFSSPYHIDHPGTTVQILGALILKIKAVFDVSGESFSAGVLSDPESYLVTINAFFVVLIAAALFLLGIFVFKISGSVYIGLISQLSCFTSENIFFGLTIFSPENFLVFLMIIVTGLIFFYFYEYDQARKKLNLIFIWAIICGAGIATKFNFIPLLIIPLFFIDGFSRKALFMVLTLIVFILFNASHI